METKQNYGSNTVNEFGVMCVFYLHRENLQDWTRHVFVTLFPWKVCWHTDAISKQCDSLSSSYLSSAILKMILMKLHLLPCEKNRKQELFVILSYLRRDAQT